MSYTPSDLKTFKRLADQTACRAGGGRVVIPMHGRLFSDALTPVLAYRRLVAPDDRMAASFLFESVEGGERVGRYSYLGCRPAAQFVARGRQVTYDDRLDPAQSRRYHSDDPLREIRQITETWTVARSDGLPAFAGGWVGYVGYDVVRYLEGEKLSSPPPDDRGLADIHLGLYRQIVAFDHVQKTMVVVTHVIPDEHESVQAAYDAGRRDLDDWVKRVGTPRPGPGGGSGPSVSELAVGQLDLDASTPAMPPSNLGPGGFQRVVEDAKRYIAAGDVFQVVASQRFQLTTSADPFDVYRALRVVNPSPYMFYLQVEGGMLVGSSPEILCRVHDRVVTSRPLAGTRGRGGDPVEDQALAAQLLDDPKERAEHVMLVDLGRNDVGRVAKKKSVQVPQVMAVERYSHVMHISSTVTGQLADDLTCWDALRYTLPVGTVTGAPKVRAMQLIDEFEPVRRGPYAGAVGYADFLGNMDMAIALRTMVITPLPSAAGSGDAQVNGAESAVKDRWIVHIQAGAGIVAESVPDTEHQETVNKAAAMAKAVRLAQQAF